MGISMFNAPGTCEWVMAHTGSGAAFGSIMMFDDEAEANVFLVYLISEQGDSIMHFASHADGVYHKFADSKSIEVYSRIYCDSCGSTFHEHKAINVTVEAATSDTPPTQETQCPYCSNSVDLDADVIKCCDICDATVNMDDPADRWKHMHEEEEADQTKPDSDTSEENKWTNAARAILLKRAKKEIVSEAGLSAEACVAIEEEVRVFGNCHVNGCHFTQGDPKPRQGFTIYAKPLPATWDDEAIALDPAGYEASRIDEAYEHQQQLAMRDLAITEVHTSTPAPTPFRQVAQTKSREPQEQEEKEA